MAELYRPSFFQPDNINGVPLAGALLYFYQATTTTPITVYQDNGLTTPHANPVVADASGIFAPIYLAAQTYKTVLKTSGAVTVQTVDNITAGSGVALDSQFRIQDNGDITKQLAFEVSGITTGTTRTITVPDASGTLSLIGLAETWTALKTFTAGFIGAWKGTTTNDSAAAGYVGEYLSTSVASGSAVGLTSTVEGQIATLSLTAGDWNVSASLYFVQAAGTTCTNQAGGINSSAALPTPPAGGASFSSDGTFPAAATTSHVTMPVRVSLASTTTYYLMARATFAVSTLAVYGFIGARRVR